MVLAEVKPGEIADTAREIVRILINSFTKHGRMRKGFALSIMRLDERTPEHSACRRQVQSARNAINRHCQVELARVS
jgi:hypothetical protein